MTSSNSFELLLELDRWDAATSDAKLATALAVADALPESFAFDKLATRTLGDQSHEIAFFNYKDCEFALLPGRSSAVLGYDRSEPYQLSDEQLADWQIVLEEYGCTFDEYLNDYLAPLRRVPISPLLFETVACPFEYAQAGDDQTEGYSQILSECGEAFRFPTTDEWEYACAAGTRQLFRWGDHCPVSNSYEDEEFTLHQQPNAFGLMMNSNTYNSELCQGPSLRGGDGGNAVCSGVGNVITWLPLASSFQVPEDEVNDWWIDDIYVRRVRSIVTSSGE